MHFLYSFQDLRLVLCQSYQDAIVAVNSCWLRAMATAVVAGEIAEFLELTEVRLFGAEARIQVSWIGLENPPAMEEWIPSELIHSNHL